MKKTAFAAFVAFWSSIATLLAVNALATDSESGAAEASGETISLEEVARHDSEDDCWMAIEGKVYDITDYIPKHPTPASILIPWCGEDATEGMRTKGYGRDHSPAAREMLEEYRLGDLADVE